MRSETNGLRAQTTTSPLGCEICNTRAFIRTQRKKKKHPPVFVFAICRLEEPSCPCRACVNHGRVGQEPATGGDSSVDEFWESW